MNAFFHRPFEKAVLLLLSLCILPNAFGNADVCTSNENGTLFYEPIQVACPPIGEPTVVASFGWASQAYNTTFLIQQAYRIPSVAASHGNGSVGLKIVLDDEIGRDCVGGQPCNTTEYATEWLTWDIFREDNCPNEFLDEEKVCIRPIFDSWNPDYARSGDRELVYIVVQNDGGCIGNVTIEAAVEARTPEPTNETLTELSPLMCWSPLAPIEEEDTGGAIPVLPEENTCDRVEVPEAGVTIGTYPGLNMSCPPVGEYVSVRAQIRAPILQGRFLPDAQMEYLVFVKHNGDNPTEGIEMGGVGISADKFFETCEGLDGVIEEREPDFFNKAGPCPESTGVNDRLCNGFRLYVDSGSLKELVYVIKNTGGCEGEIEFDMVVFDTEEVTGNALTTCIGGSTQVCGTSDGEIPTSGGKGAEPISSSAKQTYIALAVGAVPICIVVSCVCLSMMAKML